MGIHKEGNNTILIVLILTITALTYSILRFELNNIFLYLISVPFLLLLAFVIYFFRYPKLKISENENIILCPADGKIVVIEDVVEDEYFNKKMTQISIFMSPLDTHLNRYPVSGKLDYKKYHKGKYLVAWHPKSSYENERCTYAISNDKTAILLRQIAGAVARRIVPFHEVGEKFKQGDQLGFIKFGSRVDIFLPQGVKPSVEINQKVKAGKTVIASL